MLSWKLGRAQPERSVAVGALASPRCLVRAASYRLRGRCRHKSSATTASATFQVQSTWVSRRHERLPQAAQQDGVTGTVLRSLMAQILEPLERRRRKRGKTQEDKDGALSDAYDGACSRHAAHPCLPFHPQRQSHHTVSTAHTIAIWVLSGIQSEILRCRGPLPRRRLLILVVVVCSTPQSL